MVAIARRVIAELPVKWRSRLADVPIIVEERPSEDIVRDGFDPRALGLFEGPDHAARTGGSTYVTPTRIVLYAANLAAFVDPDDDEELAAEIESHVAARDRPLFRPRRRRAREARLGLVGQSERFGFEHKRRA